jgi:chemotaxis protein methyltransferase CheR
MKSVEKIEVDQFLDAAYRRYGYDFRNYARGTVTRRIKRMLSLSGLESISEMTSKMLHDKEFFAGIIVEFSIAVTELFRDPSFFCALRRDVVPFLKTHPFIKIWHAGCATGEEAYSLAILLKEEGLYDRATIFATDFNDEALRRAKEGVYPLDRIKDYTKNYQQACGKEDFSDYYHAEYDHAIMDSSLKKNITFSNHNLVTDGVFGEMSLILCRNVLIYFNKTLQKRVLNLFADSLGYNGFLCLGGKETLKFSGVSDSFEAIDNKHRIYQYKSR